MAERLHGTDDDFAECVDIRSESDRLIVRLAEKLTEPLRAESDQEKTLGELRQEIADIHLEIVDHARKIRARSNKPE